MLQNAAFLPLFRAAMGGRGKVAEARIDQLEPLAPTQAGPGAIEEIFAESSRDRMTAAAQGAGLLAGRVTTRDSLIDAARRLVFLKGDDPHDYKFSSAVLEDYYQRLARLARPLPGLEPAPVARPGGQGQQPGASGPELHSEPKCLFTILGGRACRRATAQSRFGRSFALSES